MGGSSVESAQTVRERIWACSRVSCRAKNNNAAQRQNVFRAAYPGSAGTHEEPT